MGVITVLSCETRSSVCIMLDASSTGCHRPSAKASRAGSAVAVARCAPLHYTQHQKPSSCAAIAPEQPHDSGKARMTPLSQSGQSGGNGVQKVNTSCHSSVSMTLCCPAH
eukprot:5508892-Amphidinium_carterae.1